MKLKSLLFICCFSLLSSAFADNRHIHPRANDKVDAKSAAKGARWPGYCEIEVVNRSNDDVNVFGTFDDGSTMDPFTIHRFGYDAPQFISLYYYGYCHSGMNLYVETVRGGYRLYTGYTPVGSIVEVVPYLANQQKVEVHAK
jgi:hypothetical protein